MRKLSNVTVALIVGVALYFTLVWGLDAVRMLSSPSYGLEDVWRSQFVFVIGSYVGLGPLGLLKLAAFFAALKLAVAAVCAVHVLDRLRAFIRGKADSEVLEGALILVVLVNIIAVGPSVWSQNVELVREEALQLLLAAVGAALCLVERSYARQPAITKSEPTMVLAATPRGAPWYSPFR
jgi:hypothetical protein